MTQFTTQEMHRLEDWLGLTLNGFLLAGLIQLLRYDEHSKGHYVDDVVFAGRAQYHPLTGPFTPQALRLLDPNDAAPLFRLAALQTDDELNQTRFGQALRDRQVALLRGAHAASRNVFGVHSRDFLDWTRRKFLIDWNGDKKKGPQATPLADWPEPAKNSFLEKQETLRDAIPYKAAQWHRKKRAFYETLWGSDNIHWEDNLGIGAPLYNPRAEGFSDLGQALRQFNAYAHALGKHGFWLFADYSDFCEPNAWLTD